MYIHMSVSNSCHDKYNIFEEMMKFTEAQLEAAIIELLEVEGYPHVLGETIERQPQEVY